MRSLVMRCWHNTHAPWPLALRNISNAHAASGAAGFVAPASLDFRPISGSVAIGAGASEYTSALPAGSPKQRVHLPVLRRGPL
jgi:hypothetical protein